ncbi:replication endonuclease [Shewanella algae]|uniref:replication endonuclease n=1 Tax=Shewanella algae TaxID=38313 RepID=UPI00313C8757
MMNYNAETAFITSRGTADLETERSAIGEAYKKVEQECTLLPFGQVLHKVTQLPRLQYALAAPEWAMPMLGKLNGSLRDMTKQFIARQLAFLPSPIKVHLANEYRRRIERSNLRSANIYLRKRAETLGAIWQQYPFSRKHSGDTLINYRKSKAMTATANRLADSALAAIKDAAEQGCPFVAYEAAASVCQVWQVLPPYYHAVTEERNELAAECGMLRMVCPKWWLRKLIRLRDQLVEHLYIAAGMVGKQSAYISRQSFAEWKTQQAGAQAWLESTLIENSEGITLPLIDAANAGTANPSNRFTELVVRARGLEELAEDAGKVGQFITLTAPSKFHANSDKWQQSSPKAAQEFLVSQWAKARAALGKSGIEFMGLRVVEPHKDGTPHWHMLVFLDPKQTQEALSIIRKHAFAVDGNEPGAAKHRFTVEPISPEKGSAVGYVIKYISKNIRAEFMEGETDLEAGTSAAEGAERASAWASRWNLRQFQFFGTAPVSIWRELRRIRENINPQISDHHAAADSSNWLAFEKSLQVQPLELDYELEEYGNDYGEVVRRIKGLAGDGFKIETHTDTWTIRGMDTDEKGRFIKLREERKKWMSGNKNLPKDQRPPMPKWAGFSALSGGSRAPWTCGNKCSDYDRGVVEALKTVGITAEGVDWLLEGRTVSPSGDRDLAYRLRNGQLIEVRN